MSYKGIMIEVWATNQNDYYFSKDGKLQHCFHGFTYVVPDANKLLIALTKAEEKGLCYIVPIRTRDVSKSLRDFFACQNGTGR